MTKKNVIWIITISFVFCIFFVGIFLCQKYYCPNNEQFPSEFTDFATFQSYQSANIHQVEPILLKLVQMQLANSQYSFLFQLRLSYFYQKTNHYNDAQIWYLKCVKHVQNQLKNSNIPITNESLKKELDKAMKKVLQQDQDNHVKWLQML